MDRQTAENLLDNLLGMVDDSQENDYDTALKMGIEALKACAQSVQRWIPCSEITADGYPNEDGIYYVTEQNYGFHLDADFKRIVAHISRFKNGNFVDRFYDSNHSNITAWMPLPEPYKDGELNDR